MCVRVVPLIQSKLSRVLYAHRGDKCPEDLRHQDNYRSKRAMARVRGGAEEGRHDIYGMLGGLLKDHDRGA